MKTITILLIEDNSSDARLIKEMLKEINLFKSNLITVETLRDGCEQIKNNSFDIILLDLNLPDSTGQHTLEKVLDCYKEVPIVLITGNEDEELSLEMIKEGAQDYITKQSLNPLLLGKSILYSIERKKTEIILLESDTKYRTMVTQSPDGIFMVDLSGNFLSVNKSMCDILKYTEEEFLTMKILDIIAEQNQPHHKLRLAAMLNGDKANDIAEYEVRGKDGIEHSVEVRSVLFYRGKELIGFQGVAREITEKKKAEKELRESELRFRELYQNAKIGLYRTTPDGTILMANNELVKMLGYSSFEKLAKRNLEEEGFEPSYERKEFIDRVEKYGEIKDFESTWNRLDGSLLFVRESTRVIRDSQGKTLYYDGVVEDITERKQVENAFIASETRYRRLFESAKDGILILDAETGKIVDVNPFLIELLGYSKEAFLEKEIWEIGFFKDIIANQDKFLELQQQEYVRYDNLPLETANGRKINVEFVSNVYLVNNKKVIQCNIRDITERKRVESALISSQTHLRMLVQTIPDLIWTKDADGVYLSCNPMFEKFFGAKEVDIIGKTDYDFVDRELADSFREYDRNAMAADKPTINEERIIFANDGHHVYLETIKAPIYDTQNKLIGVLGIGRDITERKLAEEKIKDNNKFLQTILNAIPTPVFYKDLEGCYTGFNKAFELFFGKTTQELIGKTAFDISSRELAEIYHAKDMELFNSPGEQVYDAQMKDSQGIIHEVVYHKATFQDSSGKISGLIGVILDITERKKAADELIEKNAFIQTILDNLPIGIALNKVDSSKAFYVNKKFEEIYGWPIDDMKDIAGFFEKVYPDNKYREELFKKIITDIESGDASRMHWEDCIIKHKDGSTHIINAVNIPLFDQNTMVSTVIDITEQKLAEKEITMLAQSLRSVNELVTITDTENKILFVNDSFLKTYGYHLDELIGENISLIQSKKNDRELVDEILPATILGEWKGELINTRKDGSEFPIYLSTSIINDKDGKSIGLIGVAVDITERKRAEIELIEAKNKAEENDKLKTAFLQNMSHEIRTPMNAIVGFSELMVLEINEPEKLEYYTKVIRQRSEDLLGIINDLLDISRIEAGQLFFKSEQVDLNKLFEELRSLFSVHNLQIEKSTINLKVNEIPSNLNSIVSTDGGKLKQILSNLIHNAFKFTSEGQIEFGFHSISKNNITLFVSDTGSGISINMKDLIFERFRKSADESVYVQDGMGLGLAIVKGLLKLFNGEIRVESELNEGSTFYFTIPYFPISIKKETEITTCNKALDWSEFTILIVEDDKFNIAYFNEIFKGTCVKLLIGETGNQAISLFTNNQNIDLVLMDIKLPDMSGYDVTKEFKHIRPDIPIIAQSAYVVDADKQKALDAGCDFFITKPIQRSILLETINRYLTQNSKK